MRLNALILLSALVAAPVARAGDLVDSRLTFGFCDDDILTGASDGLPPSPSANFGCGAQNTQFYDNYETKTSGFDNFSNFVIYKKWDKTFFSPLTIDAAIALRLNQAHLIGNGGAALRDESSYIRFILKPAGWGEKDSIQLITFPLSADRFRLGYSWRVSWGGNPIFPITSDNAKPGFKLQLKKGIAEAYIGAKTVLIRSPSGPSEPIERDTNYSILGGAGVEPIEGLKFEANGGFFQRGTNPKVEVMGAPYQTFGGSGQISYAKGDKVGTSIDFALYRNDPANPQNFFRTEQYPGGVSYTIATEATVVGTTLADPDPLKAGSTKVQPGFAGDVQARVKIDYLRLHLTAMLRDLAFLTLNQGSVIPNVAMIENLERSPEFFVAVGADYHLPKWRLTPGITIGMQQSATITSDKLGDVIGNNPGLANLGRRTVVVREDPSFAGRILQDILPNDCGADKNEPCSAKPMFGAKFSTKIDLADGVNAAAEIFTNYNPNRVTFADDQFGVAQRVFVSPLQIGFNLLAGVRF